jgi:hypothetical protein
VAVKALREEELLNRDGDVDFQALFWATARRWNPRWVAVTRYPQPDGPLRNPALKLELDALERPGWALGGDLGAARLGAPIGLAAGAAPDFYVPTRQAHRLAISILGELRDGETGRARLAAAPVRVVCEERIAGEGPGDGRWPVTRPLFVALDLAQDPGRGEEILRGWDPPGGARVW